MLLLYKNVHAPIILEHLGHCDTQSCQSTSECIKMGVSGTHLHHCELDRPHRVRMTHKTTCFGLWNALERLGTRSNPFHRVPHAKLPYIGLFQLEMTFWGLIHPSDAIWHHLGVSGFARDPIRSYHERIYCSKCLVSPKTGHERLWVICSRLKAFPMQFLARPG